MKFEYKVVTYELRNLFHFLYPTKVTFSCPCTKYSMENMYKIIHKA